jgi:hypothetical protein
MSSAHIAYSQHHDATEEVEVSALVSVYKLAISSHARKVAAAESRPDDAKGSKNDRTATEIIPKSS